MLCEFLREHRDEILKLSKEKTKNLAGIRSGSAELSTGLPLFFEQLIRELEQKLSHQPSDIVSNAAVHGKEFLRLGYSLSHVVHAYGAVCQAITETAIMRSANITAKEFQIFNGCLGVFNRSVSP